MISTTKNELFLVALRSLEKLPIQFVPSSLELMSRASWPEIAVVGRNAPEFHYTGGREELQFTLTFYAEEESRQDVMRKINWIKALRYNQGSDQPPEKIKLIFGDVFRDERWILKEVNVNLSLFQKPNNWLPQMATARLTLALDTDDDFGKYNLIR
jgi:hypothetical protein